MGQLRDYLEQTSDLDVFTGPELQTLGESIRKEQDPAIKRRMQSELSKVYQEGRVEAPVPITWSQFNEENSNALTIKTYWFNWLDRENLEKLRAIQRHYNLTPSVWSGVDEDPSLAIICFKNGKGETDYTSPNVGVLDTPSLIFWLSEKGYRSKRDGVNVIRVFSDYSADEQKIIKHHIQLDKAMIQHLEKVLYKRFPLNVDGPIPMTVHP